MSENICIINAKNGMGTSSPQISQFTHNCDCIKFVINNDFTNFALVLISSINGDVSVVSEGEYLTKTFNSETGETVVLWYPTSIITSESGCVLYQLAAYDAVSNETIWYSKEGRLIVTDSIDTDDYSASHVGSQPNLVTQILTLAKSLELEINNLSQNKVDKSEGKMLTSNDFTDVHIEKLNEAHSTAFHNADLIDNLQHIADENAGEESYNPESQKAQSGKAVAMAIAGIVNSAPETLNTLDELSKALGNDPNFATTIMTLLGEKVDKIRADEIESELEAHSSNTKNPHKLTKSQLGLGSVDNTPDMDKPISKAVRNEISRLDGEINDNLKPALEDKVNKEDGKALSSNDFTDELKSKLDNIDGEIKGYLDHINEPEEAITAPLLPNKQYILGETETLSLVFPSSASAGDVVYLTFLSGDFETNLSIDTTNTCDIEIIPEKNTGYEVFGKFNGTIWVVGYSEYIVSEGQI